eukprot:CAMPEP_0184495594 /NCGR_PEP_ID=MMETSP0113_2-20130426/31791_1 /TAXON_ID=91329 /ORGANISM="Norrisiella sphaerica, Strain BC52" /LENGTH=412 /DNA_ID=CAMNT_0026881851 /DNA_START=102 /DNA_END=1340 /DNA_ORIENTATION=+
MRVTLLSLLCVVSFLGVLYHHVQPRAPLLLLPAPTSGNLRIPGIQRAATSSLHFRPAVLSHRKDFTCAHAPLRKISNSLRARSSGDTPVATGGGENVAKVQKPKEISTEWELDVYSRPVVNGGKKLWEMLLCDKTGGWQFIEQMSPDKVTSKEINRLLMKAIEDAPVKPTAIRFFRKQALSVIKKALDPLEKEENVRAIKSKTTYALFDWIRERNEKVYPFMDGYVPPKKQAKTSGFLYSRPSESLPSYLEGEDWSFSEVELGDILQNTQDMTEAGRVCEVDASIPRDTMVPGLIVYSTRARALAVALQGSCIEYGDINSVSVDEDRGEIVYEVGVEDKWRVGKLDDERLVREGAAFEAKKNELGGLHFLAIHQLPKFDLLDIVFNRKKELGDEEIEGFWLMRQGSIGWKDI